MHRALLLACTLALSMAGCCGFSRPVPPDPDWVPDAPDSLPVDPLRLRLPDTPLLPGLTPQVVFATLAAQYDLICGDWQPEFNLYYGSCYTPAPAYPGYALTVASREIDTVDEILASVVQERDALDREAILAYFEAVLSLPYAGSSPDAILAWLRPEIEAAEPSRWVEVDLTLDEVDYKLSGFITLINLQIGHSEPFLELP